MKKILGFVLRAGISVGILAVILAKTDLSKMGATFASISGETVAFVAALTLLQTAIGAWRWVVAMNAVDVALTPWNSLKTLYASLFLNQCLPSYVGGDAYRIFWLYRREHPLGASVRGVVMDRTSAVMALVLMIGVSLPLLLARFPDPRVRSGLILLVCAGVGGAAVFLGCDRLPASWLRWRPLEELATLSKAGRRLFLSWPSGPLVGALAVSVHVLTATVMFLFAVQMTLPLSFLDCLLLVPPITLLAAVPISIAGWGVREGVMVGALAMLHIGTEKALALSILLGCTLLANGLIGVVPLMLSGEKMSEMQVPGDGLRVTTEK